MSVSDFGCWKREISNVDVEPVDDGGSASSDEGDGRDRWVLVVHSGRR